jgi:hypothetical protein
MRLLYRFIEMPEGAEAFPLSLIRVLVALSEQMDDRLRNTALGFLCELGNNFMSDA